MIIMIMIMIIMIMIMMIMILNEFLQYETNAVGEFRAHRFSLTWNSTWSQLYSGSGADHHIIFVL